jgi:hypothetical protein
MKKIIALTLIAFFLFTTVFSQTNKSSNHSPDYNALIQKSKRQKTAAWVCLGGGFVMLGTGIVITAAYLPVVLITSIAKDTRHEPAWVDVLSITGAAGMAASIPLFISAGNNKHKANITVSNQKSVIGLPMIKNIPGITIAIALR